MTAEQPRSALGEFILARMAAIGAAEGRDRPLSCREVAARSDGAVTAVTVNRYCHTTPNRPVEPRIIKGLAKALQVAPGEIEARLPEDPYGSPYIPPRDSALLTQEQRRIVDALIKELAQKPRD